MTNDKNTAAKFQPPNIARIEGDQARELWKKIQDNRPAAAQTPHREPHLYRTISTPRLPLAAEGGGFSIYRLQAA